MPRRAWVNVVVVDVRACGVARAWDLASAKAPHRVPGDWRMGAGELARAPFRYLTFQALPGVFRFPGLSPLELEIVTGCVRSPLAWEIERWKVLSGIRFVAGERWPSCFPPGPGPGPRGHLHDEAPCPAVSLKYRSHSSAESGSRCSDALDSLGAK